MPLPASCHINKTIKWSTKLEKINVSIRTLNNLKHGYTTEVEYCDLFFKNNSSIKIGT